MKKVFPFLFVILSFSLIAQENASISDYTTAIKLDPSDAVAYVNRGAAYKALGEYNAAIDDYRSALRLDPDMASAYYNRGNGKIWFFRCPFSNARCRKLYLIRGYFQNRTEHSKSFYQTQTVGTKDKYLIRQFDRLQKANKAEETIKRKYFKRFYNGKPTKRYLKLLKDFEAGAGISEAELFIK